MSVDAGLLHEYAFESMDAGDGTSDLLMCFRVVFEPKEWRCASPWGHLFCSKRVSDIRSNWRSIGHSLQEIYKEVLKDLQGSGILRWE